MEYFDVSFTGCINNMSKICNSISFYSSMLIHFDVESDDDFVRHVVEVFIEPYPYTLRDWFKRYMMSDDTFASKLRQRVSELGLEMPKSIEPDAEEEGDVNNNENKNIWST